MSDEKPLSDIATDIASNLTELVEAVTEDDEDLHRDAILFLRALATALTLIATAVKTSLFSGIIKKMIRKVLVSGRARLETVIAEKLQKFL